MPHGLAPFSSIRTPESKGVGNASTTRPSSSANFFVDSLDRNIALPAASAQSAGNFIINKQQSLFNGFFNRIAVSEVVVDWGIPNVAEFWGNNTFTVTLSGVNTGTFDAVISDGFYTVEQALDAIAEALNIAIAAPGPSVAVFVVNQVGNTYELAIDQGVTVSSYLIGDTLLGRALFTSSQIANTTPLPTNQVLSPLILGTRYIDIVSQQLTLNQDLKDSTTAEVVRDVLYRWYFAWDNNAIDRDGYGFPILQGYEPFNVRRPIPYPKQIRWNPSQPIGQVSFQVYDDQGRLINVDNYDTGANFQFQMSMLLSED
jgi:hypothetical protein